jgi:hypothetical protein
MSHAFQFSRHHGHGARAEVRAGGLHQAVCRRLFEAQNVGSILEFSHGFEADELASLNITNADLNEYFNFDR